MMLPPHIIRHTFEGRRYGSAQGVRREGDSRRA